MQTESSSFFISKENKDFSRFISFIKLLNLNDNWLGYQTEKYNDLIFFLLLIFDALFKCLLAREQIFRLVHDSFPKYVLPPEFNETAQTPFLINIYVCSMEIVCQSVLRRKMS